MSFTWANLIPGVGHEYAHVATAGATSVALIAIAFIARGALGNGETAIVPASKPSIRGIFEMITEFLVGIIDLVIGEEGRKYVPFFSALFLFILFNNLCGMIPGVAPATENINMTFPMGVASFVAYNYYGLKENGISYLKHFLGPIWWLFWLMLPIELISNLLRPLTLGLRLANVITGDHTVVETFLNFPPHIGIPIPFYLLGILVCLIQAFVFTVLSMVYIALATAHDH